jgi:hypothetical protein
MQTMTEEQERRIAAKFNAYGFDAKQEVGDLPYFVGLREWKERHGDAVPDLVETSRMRHRRTSDSTTWSIRVAA